MNGGKPKYRPHLYLYNLHQAYLNFTRMVLVARSFMYGMYLFFSDFVFISLSLSLVLTVRRKKSLSR